ncbi:hypothetical protein PPTG_11961 [Phytophthora nicotianae INRA-310]|uniref:Integrase catalytic domain-containing protein n=1 Tax=Phytophthora nicotianae (strain INRA-310) TaxID=761204 RepID=W2Q4H2_PHYN3|nr:hypothetical protein PPTG_11961 [Phytophthora nicotianae INRA-310]ETN08093.1 hypothetical protein PPTG_11961 [Phytophthora nicotianae INRA-310]
MLLGLVERYHKVWKDMVSLYVREKQDDWDEWIPCAAYAYNGARHGTTGYSPNELMMGRQLKTPNELLRASAVEEIGDWTEYHQRLINQMERAAVLAKIALQQDQRRREHYYNRQVRCRTNFKTGELVWVLKPPRGKGVTKLAHQWVGPAKLAENVGFDNWLVERQDLQESLIVHTSFLVSYYYPKDRLGTLADRILTELDEDDITLSYERNDTVELNTTTADDCMNDDGDFRAHSDSLTSGKADRDVDQEVPVEANGESARHAVRRPGPAVDEGAGVRRALGEALETARQALLEGTPALTTGKRTGAPEIPLPVVPAPQRSYEKQVEIRMKAPPITHNRKKPQSSSTQATGEDEAQQRRRQKEADARAARAARRGTLRDQQPQEETTEVDTTPANRVPGTATAHNDERDAVGDGGDAVNAAPARGTVTLTEGTVPIEVANERTGERDNRELERTGGDGRGDAINGGGQAQTAATQALRGRQQAPGTSHDLRTPFTPTTTAVVIYERGQRRIRNRAGRYETQHQVEYRYGPGRPTRREWLTAEQFDVLVDEGKIEDDLLAGDGVWTGDTDVTKRAADGDAGPRR